MDIANGNTINSVDLRCFESIEPDKKLNKKSRFNILEVTQYKTSTVRLRLPIMISEKLAENDRLDVLINKPGTIIAIRKNENGFVPHVCRSTYSIFSSRLNAVLSSKKVSLPASFETVYEERNDCWICREKK
jgi:hypothetical protein